MNFRSYQPTDRDACTQIFLSNCPKYFDVSERVFWDRWLDALDTGEVAYAHSSNDLYDVLEVNGEMVGCGGFYVRVDDNQVAFAWGMVHNKHHKKGYGKALYLHRLARIKSLYPSFGIVLNTSQHTVGFFETFGFQTTEITLNGYGPGLDRYDMVLTHE